MRPTALLILPLALGSACASPPEPTSASDELLSWAEQVAAALRTRELHDDLEERLAATRGGDCPEVAPSAPPLPPWYPERVTNQPSVTSGYPTDPGQGEHPAETWSGECGTESVGWSGSAVDATFTLSQAPCMFGPERCDTSSEWWEFDALTLAPLPGEDSEDLALTGYVYVLDDEWESGSGCANREWETSSYRGGALTVEQGSSAPRSPLLLGAGLATLDWAWDTLDAKSPTSSGCVRARWSSLRASVQWEGGDISRSFDADLSWLWSEGDGGQAGSEGCRIEPLSGTVELSDATAPNAGPSVLITFDGEAACDGCGDLTVDGEAAGTWCPATGFASP